MISFRETTGTRTSLCGAPGVGPGRPIASTGPAPPTVGTRDLERIGSFPRLVVGISLPARSDGVARPGSWLCRLLDRRSCGGLLPGTPTVHGRQLGAVARPRLAQRRPDV